MAARSHRKQAAGHDRAAERQPGTVRFHSLRHTATSLRKNAGVSDVIAHDLIGHEPAEIRRPYTHIDDAAKPTALNKLPVIE